MPASALRITRCAAGQIAPSLALLAGDDVRALESPDGEFAVAPP